jgi:hypothetical protein
MANPKTLDRLLEGIPDWNEWRKQNPYINVNLAGVDLGKADLGHAHLRYVNLTEANLYMANLSRADLCGADLYRANLGRVDLRSADLRWAKLGWADLHRADLSGADMRSATLQNTILDSVIATDTKLWETQRAGWSIKGIFCERAYWDKEAKEPIAYVPGEFERLYSDQTCIELFYPGGVTTFELNTLPALFHHLASLHPDTFIRLKSIEETGGGAKISVSVGDADSATAEKIKADAMRVYQAQLALRDDRIKQLEIEQNYMQNVVFEKLIKAMLRAGTQQIVFNAPVYGPMLTSGNATLEVHQTIKDNPAILALLEKMIDRRTELGLSKAEATKLESELESTVAELQNGSTEETTISKSLETIREIVKGALANFAGSAAAIAASANWQTWMDQLTQFIQQLK